MSNGILFKGSHSEIVKACPDKFFDETNMWHDLAQSIITNGVSCSNWEFIDLSKKAEQYTYLDTLCGDTTIENGDKIAVVSWMLSAMLVEVPTYISPVVRKNLRKDPRGITRKLASKKTA